MSEVVTGILKLTFGFISKKVRTYGAEKLQDGGLADQKFRDWIVRELDDIKFKIDCLSRKDLFTSISCLKQGVQRLNMCFGESAESGDSSTSELSKSEKQSQDTIDVGASTSTQTDTRTKFAQTSVAIDDAVALANAISKLKIESNEVFELAKESFKEAGKKASEAFHNAALSTEERILASKVRIASGILEHLERPEVAASDCLQYLQELHDLPAISDIFSVHIKPGIKSRIKSGFKKDSRTEIVETVTMINLILADFISKFTKRRMAVFDWPMITCGKRVVHPIHYKKDSLANPEEMEITPPWDMVLIVEAGVRFRCAALNKQGDVVCVSRSKTGPQKLDKTTGKLQPYCLSPSQDKYTWNVCTLTVDEDDTVYVLSGNENVGYTLSVYSTNGRNTHRCTLEFLKRLVLLDIRMTVTKEKNIVICCRLDVAECFKVWLCDCNGELRNSFVARQTKDHDSIDHVSVSCSNEIILITTHLCGRLFPLTKGFNMLHIYTEDGHLQRTLTFRPSDKDFYRTAYYNNVTKKIIGCYNFCDNDNIYINVGFLSDKTGGLLESYSFYKTNLPKDPEDIWCLVCHTNGTLALIGQNYVLFLQKPSK